MFSNRLIFNFSSLIIVLWWLLRKMLKNSIVFYLEFCYLFSVVVNLPRSSFSQIKNTSLFSDLYVEVGKSALNLIVINLSLIYLLFLVALKCFTYSLVIYSLKMVVYLPSTSNKRAYVAHVSLGNICSQ